MKRIAIVIGACLLLATQQGTAKVNSDLIKANYLYTHLGFHEAIGYYEKLAPTMNDPEIYAKLGDCYRLTKNPQQAAMWYEKALAAKGAPEDTRLHYAQVLMNLERYDEAATFLRQYNTKKEDRRVANMIKSCEGMQAMKSAIPVGSVTFESFNTNGSDFGPSIRNNNELFFTVDTVINGNAKTDVWTGNSFYKIYSIACNQYQCSGNLQQMGGNVNTKYHDGPCTFTANGDKMYFTRTNVVQRFLTRSPLPDENSTVHLQIMVASDYDAASKKYKKIEPFAFNDREYSTAHPAINKEGNIILFASDMPGGEGGNDLYMTRKSANGNWSKPVNLGKSINTEGNEMFPYIGENNTLYFASDGWVGHGGLDVYSAKWDATTNSFAEPRNMGMPINSAYDDMSLILDSTASMGYFASNRPAEKKGDNIYSFNRMGMYVAINVVDASTGMAVPNADIALQSPNGRAKYTTDDNGRLFAQLMPNTNTFIYASKMGYDSAMTNATTVGITRSDTLKKTLRLKQDFQIQYNAVVMDEETREPIENPLVIFVQNNPKHVDSVRMGTGDVFTASLEPNKSYNLYAVKDNYYGNEKYISTKNITPNATGVRMNDTVWMKKLQVGQVYNIDNIYYDYNKANIREDAKPSLDRLLNLLGSYPGMSIQINSHTDCRGSDSYNKTLSNARANSVVKYLQLRGIPLNRLKYKGFGESMPVEKCTKCEECTEAQHQRNRRTEFQILTM